MSLMDEITAWINKESGQHLKVCTGELIFGTDYDKILIIIISSLIDDIEFYMGSDLVRTTRVTYRDSTKDDAESVVIL